MTRALHSQRSPLGMKRRWIIVGVSGLAALYVAAPIIAGATRTGDREGPVIYPEGFHASLYIIGHEVAFQEKPRQRMDCWMYRRPLFYGMPRRLKSEVERQAYIDMARRNQSPRIDDLVQMNDKAKTGPHGTALPLRP